MNLFRGTGVAVITPFHADKSIDIPAIQRVAAHLMAGKVEYLVVLGSTGEAATLNMTEKQIVIEAYLAATKGEIPIVLGCGGNDTREVCENITFYTEKYGNQIAAFLSVSPCYNKPSQEGIFQHFKAVAACTDKPIIIYNVPGRTGSNILPQTTVRIATEIENVVAIKESSGNLEQMMEIICHRPQGFLVISGDDAITLPLIAAGGDGLISVVAHAAPDKVSNMVRAALSNDFETARKLHYDLWELISLAFAEGNPMSIKTMMEVKGLCGRAVRLPLVEGTAGLVEKVKKIFS